jgi:hypothetical protein
LDHLFAKRIKFLDMSVDSAETFTPNKAISRLKREAGTPSSNKKVFLFSRLFIFDFKKDNYIGI